MISDEEAIRALVAAWLAATKRGNLETLSGLMATGALFMAPGQDLSTNPLSLRRRAA
jgi:ketosteroid isomerase-like protein